MNISGNFGCSRSTCAIEAFSTLTTTLSIIAEALAYRSGWPLKQPSQEVSAPMERDDGFLPMLGYDGDLELALPNEEDRIRRVALREDLLILAVLHYGPSTINGVEKDLYVEWTSLRPNHDAQHPVPVN
jgi:hypothetical protein